MSRLGRAALAGLAVLSGAALGGCEGAVGVRAVEKSMEPTVLSGEIVSVDYDAYSRRSPRVGEIASTRTPRGAESERCGVETDLDEPCARPTPALGDLYVIKRIVAGPGDRVAIRADGRVEVDGVVTPEPYLQTCRYDECALPSPVRVPEDHWFVLGDNRPYSSDSRFWGPVPTAAFEGPVTLPATSRR